MSAKTLMLFISLLLVGVAAAQQRSTTDRTAAVGLEMSRQIEQIVTDEKADEAARIKRIENHESVFQPRIVGGQPASPGEWPWTAALVIMRSDGTFVQFCGGALIAQQWILTAAHCEVQLTDRVIIGRTNLTTSLGEVHTISSVFNHPNYNAGTKDSDIALLRLGATSAITPVGLITAADAQPQQIATVVGWGDTTEGGAGSSNLLEVDVPVITNTACQTAYSGTGVTITANMVCAGRQSGGIDSCQGDSGGPLMLFDSTAQTWRQGGVVSFGIGCARPNFFGIYTRVARFLPWITQTMTAVAVGPSSDTSAESASMSRAEGRLTSR